MLKKVLSILLLFTGGYTSNGQVEFKSLEEVWQYADAHNITIRSAKYEVEKSLYSKRQSYSALLPQVSANGTYTNNIQLQTTVVPANTFNPAIPSDSIRTFQFGRQFVYVGGVTAQMSVLNLQNIYNTRIAKETEELNNASLANTRKNIYQQVATQYYSILLMGEALKLSGQMSLIADSIYQSVNNKYKEGTANAANVDIAKLNLNRAQQNYIAAQYQVQIARNNMKILLGIPAGDSLHIRGNLDEHLLKEQEGTFKEDPAIRLAMYQTKISLSQYRASNIAFAPTINLAYNYNIQRFDDKFEPFVEAKGAKAWFPAQYWMLQASWPLFTGGSRYFQSKKNKIAWEQSKEQYEQARNQSVLNDENIRLSYQRSLAVLNKTKEVMNLSLDNYRHVTNRQQSGIVSIEERLTAFKDYIDYQNQYLNSLSDMLVQLYTVKIRQQSF
ncbi:MAG: TolC family protein [Flavipsychrobacter sp.]|jgi:outer membrane protein TolC|nr:TolC family protein [Flavipsychrobacter sp.]